MPSLPPTRILITSIAAVAGVVAFFATKGSYPVKSSWPLGISMGAFIGVYVLGSLLWGVVQGIREAQTKPRPPGDSGKSPS